VVLNTPLAPSAKLRPELVRGWVEGWVGWGGVGLVGKLGLKAGCDSTATSLQPLESWG